MIFLEKIEGLASMAEFRGISVLSVLGKWYMMCLVLLAQVTPLPCVFEDVVVIGYQPHHSTDHIASSLLVLCCKAYEYRPLLGFLVLSLTCSKPLIP